MTDTDRPPIPPPRPGPPNDLLALLEIVIRRRRPAPDVRAQLAGWGIELGADETCERLWICRVDGRPSYVAVTSTRLLVFDEAEGGVPAQHPLPEPRGIGGRPGGFRRGRLVITWPTGATLAVDGLGRRDHAELAGLLRRRD